MDNTTSSRNSGANNNAEDHCATFLWADPSHPAARTFCSKMFNVPRSALISRCPNVRPLKGQGPDHVLSLFYLLCGWVRKDGMSWHGSEGGRRLRSVWEETGTYRGREMGMYGVEAESRDIRTSENSNRKEFLKI